MHPLCWPEHIARARHRTVSAFNRKERSALGIRKRKLRYTEAEAELLDELGRLKASHVVISSNVSTRSSLGDISDPGVACFFRRRGQAQVIACDQYTTAADNAYAIAMTIAALRTIERHGSATLGDQAFSAFRELPPGASDAPRARHWREVLGVPNNIERAVQLDLAEMYYRRGVQKAHPDRGGTEAAMQELNGAIARAREELR